VSSARSVAQIKSSGRGGTARAPGRAGGSGGLFASSARRAKSRTSAPPAPGGESMREISLVRACRRAAVVGSSPEGAGGAGAGAGAGRAAEVWMGRRRGRAWIASLARGRGGGSVRRREIWRAQERSGTCPTCTKRDGRRDEASRRGGDMKGVHSAV
jgi:hypothetical protein